MAQVDARRLIPFGKHGTVDTHASVIKRKHPQGALSFSAPNVLSPTMFNLGFFLFWLENRFGRPRYLRFDFKWTVMRLEVRLESDQWLDQNYVIEFESNSNPNLGRKTPRNKNTHEFIKHILIKFVKVLIWAGICSLKWEETIFALSYRKIKTLVNFATLVNELKKC